MESFVMVLIGIGIIFLGYLIAFRQMVRLLHSYHYKRVKEEDLPVFCKWSGIGTMIVGVGLVIIPILGETVGLILALAGIALGIAVIIKYNHGLF